jgi:hypothetical protein
MYIYKFHASIFHASHSCCVCNTFISHFQVSIHPYLHVDFIFLSAEMLVMYMSLDFSYSFSLYTYNYMIRIWSVAEWICGMRDRHLPSSPFFPGFETLFVDTLSNSLDRGSSPPQGRYIYRTTDKLRGRKYLYIYIYMKSWTEWDSNPRSQLSAYYLLIHIEVQCAVMNLYKSN